jgi:hypothetical protein
VREGRSGNEAALHYGQTRGEVNNMTARITRFVLVGLGALALSGAAVAATSGKWVLVAQDQGRGSPTSCLSCAAGIERPLRAGVFYELVLKSTNDNAIFTADVWCGGTRVFTKYGLAREWEYRLRLRRGGCRLEMNASSVDRRAVIQLALWRWR